MNSEDRYQAVSNLAHDLWISRGQPIGSPEIDWEHAERLLDGSDDEGLDASSIDVLSFSADLAGDFNRVSSQDASFMDDDEPTQVSGAYGEKDIRESTSPSPKIPDQQNSPSNSRGNAQPNSLAKKNKASRASELDNT